MPYPKRDPVPEDEFLYVEEPSEAAMFKEAHPGHKSVCQTLRDVYAMTESDEAKTKLRLAWAMMKAMNDKLHYYKNKYEPWRGKHA